MGTDKNNDDFEHDDITMQLLETNMVSGKVVDNRNILLVIGLWCYLQPIVNINCTNQYALEWMNEWKVHL